MLVSFRNTKPVSLVTSLFSMWKGRLWTVYRECILSFPEAVLKKWSASVLILFYCLALLACGSSSPSAPSAARRFCGRR